MDREFYKARITSLEMLKDRNYKYKNESGQWTNEFENLLVNFDDFKEMYRDANTDPSVLDLTDIIDTENIPVLVHFVIQEKEKTFFSQLDTKYDKSIFKEIDPATKNIGEFKKDRHLIIVYVAPDKKEGYDFIIEEEEIAKRMHSTKPPRIELFAVQKMVFNVTKHILQKNFKLITDEEDKKKVLDKFNANKNMLQKYCIDDPVVLYFGGKKDDIFEISGNGYLPSYRLVTGRTLPKRTKK